MEIPDSLKAPNSREPARRLHILVMTDGGATRRFSLSTNFLWVLAAITLLVFLALGVLSYVASSLLVDYRSLRNNYDFDVRRLETMAYNQSVPTTPEAAGRLLERLDRAALSVGGDDGDLPQGLPPDDADEAGDSGGDPETPAAGTAPVGNPGAQAGEGAETGEGAQVAAASEGQSPPPADGEATGAAVGPTVPAGPTGPSGPEEEAWAALHNRLVKPEGPAVLDVDEFRFSQDGAYSYYLKQATSPGERLRGRAVTIFAVADRDGNVRLVPDPEFDLRNPSQGWDLGGRYNIISSKVYRGRIRIPQGGKALSVEVLAWDEETKELIFLKSLSLDGED
ncbi:MAG: hypothetical protein LBR80_11275 [Deltaproteobacteria bacterium]|nr:hypothetical protein [Deltaproteobacteria bacterium]